MRSSREVEASLFLTRRRKRGPFSPTLNLLRLNAAMVRWPRSHD